MFIDLFGLIMLIVVVIISAVFFYFAVKRKDKVSKTMAILMFLIVVVFAPIQYEKDILVDYEFSPFDTHGRLDYISPFTGEEESVKINGLHLYNELRKHNHIRMKRTYTLMFPLGEQFIVRE